MRTAAWSAGVVGIVGLLSVAMTTPAEALPHTHEDSVTAPANGSTLPPNNVQAYAAPAGTLVTDLARDSTYGVGTLVDLASATSISNFSDTVFTNDTGCAVQWPYPAGVPITYGFGMRDGRMHEGTDFVPGRSAQIQAVADGVVRVATDNGGAFGVTIVIDHFIDGALVSTRYAHMEYNSRQVEVGDTVQVGQYIGRTGNTGRSFGDHLHFEILQNGSQAVDPLPWLRMHATC
ncbi:M23 family metallopeptidase [Microbacterium sp. B19]|uniref:M23 family metallopeptidase n=2 Tax=unclassified Microbacterium TaxID=2609290 RepID=UPI001650D512|nr:M23 family metallopeptidase [Microbacterium sp. B19]